MNKEIITIRDKVSIRPKVIIYNFLYIRTPKAFNSVYVNLVLSVRTEERIFAWKINNDLKRG
jgi:hypothetical protein